MYTESTSSQSGSASSGGGLVGEEACYLLDEEVQAGLELIVPGRTAIILSSGIVTSDAGLPIGRLPSQTPQQLHGNMRYIVAGVYADDTCHWTLLIYDHQLRTAMVWDSFKLGSEQRLKNTMRNFLCLLHLAGLNIHIKWRHGQGPSQCQNWTCGWHVLESARAYLLETGLLDFRHSVLYSGTKDNLERETQIIRNWRDWAGIRVGVVNLLDPKSGAESLPCGTGDRLCTPDIKSETENHVATAKEYKIPLASRSYLHITSSATHIQNGLPVQGISETPPTSQCGRIPGSEDDSTRPKSQSIDARRLFETSAISGTRQHTASASLAQMPPSQGPDTPRTTPTDLYAYRLRHEIRYLKEVAQEASMFVSREQIIQQLQRANANQYIAAFNMLFGYVPILGRQLEYTKDLNTIVRLSILAYKLRLIPHPFSTPMDIKRLYHNNSFTYNKALAIMKNWRHGTKQ
ncbi:hypothetical protein F4678DRAFT_430464 [Xylaria arbuscula]|nr:hypothetical protein F4678DRAFT_430464 [Xylaria arbuscula]